MSWRVGSWLCIMERGRSLLQTVLRHRSREGMVYLRLSDLLPNSMRSNEPLKPHQKQGNPNQTQLYIPPYYEGTPEASYQVFNGVLYKSHVASVYNLIGALYDSHLDTTLCLLRGHCMRNLLLTRAFYPTTACRSSSAGSGQLRFRLFGLGIWEFSSLGFYSLGPFRTWSLGFGDLV